MILHIIALMVLIEKEIRFGRVGSLFENLNGDYLTKIYMKNRLVSEFLSSSEPILFYISESCYRTDIPSIVML